MQLDGEEMLELREQSALDALEFMDARNKEASKPRDFWWVWLLRQQPWPVWCVLVVATRRRGDEATD